MAKRKKRLNVVTGLTASVRYDRKRERLVLTLRARSQRQARALYMFVSAQKHPAVCQSAKLNTWGRLDGAMTKADLVFELHVEGGMQALLEAPMTEAEENTAEVIDDQR